VLGHEIAHADRAHLAIGEQLLERAIGIERQVEPARQRLMQQQQIDAVAAAQLAGTLVERV
jgi:hypothetical protein